MSDQQNKPLALTVSALNSAANLAAVFDLVPFQNNFVNNLVKTSGVTEEGAIMKFEREKILFMKAIAANKELEQCERFSIYSAFIELAVSGQSLLDGESYIIPYGKKAQFQVGYKGRINQMNTLPGIVHVAMPQVVYDCDVFDYEFGEEPRILKHKPKKDRPKDAILTHVYLIIEREPTPSSPKAKDVYLMDREEVLAIRDRYSQPYRHYIADCKKLNKEIGSTFKKTITKRDGGSFEMWVEPPMWVSNETEAWKKTIVKRAYKWVPKTARMKALDARIAQNVDPETGEVPEELIDYGIVNGDGTTEHVKGSSSPASNPADNPPIKEQEPAQEAPKEKAPTKTSTKKKEPEKAKETPSAAADIDDIAGADTHDVGHTEVTDEDLGNPLESF